MSLKEYVIGVFVFMPIITLIHEFGHVFFAKIFGAEIKKIVIGTGNTLLVWGKLEVRSVYFWFGHFEADKLGDSKLAKIVTLLGGAIFNLASCLIIIIFRKTGVISGSNLINLFLNFSLYTIVVALAPIKYANNKNSDGLQVYQIITKGSSSFGGNEV